MPCAILGPCSATGRHILPKDAAVGRRLLMCSERLRVRTQAFVVSGEWASMGCRLGVHTPWPHSGQFRGSIGAHTRGAGARSGRALGAGSMHSGHAVGVCTRGTHSVHKLGAHSGHGVIGRNLTGPRQPFPPQQDAPVAQVPRNPSLHRRFRRRAALLGCVPSSACPACVP